MEDYNFRFGNDELEAKLPEVEKDSYPKSSENFPNAFYGLSYEKAPPLNFFQEETSDISFEVGNRYKSLVGEWD